MLMNLAKVTNWKLDVKTVTCDFELAIVNLVKQTYPKAKNIGCLFHWKQAIRRKLLAMGFDPTLVSSFMKPGRLDLLTGIPVQEIEVLGIPYLRSLEAQTSALQQKWDAFWDYFKQTCMVRYKMQDWNISDMEGLTTL